jgi:cyclomaltodextrinase
MQRSTPSWVADAVFYQIFPDRFRRGAGSWPADADEPNRRICGGDLRGIRDALPYLEDLGITALYLTPIFTATSYHRYDTVDYFAVDPILGGDDALRAVIADLRERRMHLILDGVFNHCSSEHPFFVDVVERGRASEYWDWFSIHGDRVSRDPSPNYACWAGVPSMPEWNHDHPPAREYLLEVVRYWLEAFGIDGWRLDTAEYLPPDFVRDVLRVAKSVDPEAYVLGEVMGLATPWFRHHALDGVMHYKLWERLVSFIAEEDLGAEQFVAGVYSIWRSYPLSGNYSSLTLLGSHDKPRFLTLSHGDRRRLLLATAFLLTFPGAPGIYYGDEIGMEGGEDPDNRRCFPWDEAAWDSKVFGATRDLIRLRNDQPALRCGSIRNLYAHGRTLAYARELGADRIVVALNADPNKTASVPLDEGAHRDLLSGATHRDRLDLAPLSYRIVRRESTAG